MSEVVEGIDTFPEQIRDDVNGLAWLGYLEDEFEYAGHKFVIRTLKGDEELIAGTVTSKYSDTMSHDKAWAWANIALCLTSVDGDEDFCPQAGPDKEDYGRARFQYVTSKWYWPTAKFIFNQYVDLIRRQLIAIDAVRNLSTGSQTPSMPSQNFSTDPESLAQETLALAVDAD